MIFKCIDGPMDGAVYHLDRKLPQTTRKPDGLWFNAQDEHGRWVQHQYRDTALGDVGESGVAVHYTYDGQVETVDTGIEMEMREQLEGFDCSAGFAPQQSVKTELETTAEKLSDGWLFLDSYARDERFTPQMAARILINQGAPGWKGATKSCTECGNPYPCIEFLDGHIECKSCRTSKQSFDDLAASGGIVDAP